MAEQIAAIIGDGNAAKPSEETVGLLRNSFAPATIAKKYLELLLPQ